MVRISIIIATYNRAESLVRTLKSVVGQTLDRQMWEVWVVNNNSSDDTLEKFEEFSRDNIAFNLNIVTEEKQGLSHARNRGISESCGDIIAIIDDDEEINPLFAASYLDLFDNYPQASAAGGKIIPHYDFDLPEWMSKYTERPIAGTLDMGEEVREFPRNKYPGGGNMAVRRSILEKYGSFNPELGRTGSKLLGGEEKDLFHRLSNLGEKIYYAPQARIFHIIPKERITPDYLRKVCFMIGQSERYRTINISKWSYAKRLAFECVKWGGTFVVGISYILKGSFSKCRYLFLLRYNISLGLLSKIK